MLEGKTCLVTGATSGIGKEIAIGLAKLGGTVVLAGRSRSRCEAAAKETAHLSDRKRDEFHFVIADLASRESIISAAEDFKKNFPRLDVLVNNAGVFRARRELTTDGLEYTFAVNHLAPFLLTNLLIDMLKSARARVVTTSSIAHRGARIDFEDLQFERRRYNGIRAYGQSKLANILFTKELAQRLDGSGTANCFHPGGVRTNLSQGNPWYYQLLWSIVSPFLLSPEKGADTGVYLASSPEVDGRSGGYYVKRREVAPSAEAGDLEAARRLWSTSQELVVDD
jgi:retinol dehydrogenase 12